MIPTVVICALNEEEYIEYCLQTILDQDYKGEYEVLVVDNGSTDRTREIAEQYCTVLSAPRGKLFARIEGISKAKGDIIIALDADCHVLDNFVSLHMRHYENPEVIAVQGNILHTGSLATILLSGIVSRVTTRLQGANSSFRKEAYFNCGGFDTSINQFDMVEMCAEEEIVFYNKLKQLGQIEFDAEAICFHSNRGLHGSVAKDLRLTDERSLEIIKGERF